MKKEYWYRLMYVISGLLVLGFAIRLGTDWVQYDDRMTSAPFYTFVLIRAVEFLLPAVLIFAGAFLIRKIIRK